VEVTRGGVVVSLTQADATLLAEQLTRALQLAYGARHADPPRLLEAFANQISRAGRGSGSARFRADAQVRPSRGTAGFRDDPLLQSSDQPVIRFSIQEAANLANVSEGLMRRNCRRGDVQASRAGPRSAWAVDIASLATWISARRRKEHDDHKAA
jgi:hypothetical protein